MIQTQTEYFGSDSRRGDTHGVIWGIPHRYYSTKILKTALPKDQTQILQDCLTLNPLYPRRNRKFREKFIQTLASKEMSVIGSDYHQDENAGMAYWSEAYKFATPQDVQQFGVIMQELETKLRGMVVDVVL